MEVRRRDGWEMLSVVIDITLMVAYFGLVMLNFYQLALSTDFWPVRVIWFLVLVNLFSTSLSNVLVVYVANCRTRKALADGEIPPLAEPVLTYHGNSLDEVALALSREPLEHLAYFTEDTEKIIELTQYHPCRVGAGRYGQVLQHYRRVTSVHNHPIFGGEASFSSEDVVCMLRHREHRMIAVTVQTCYVMTMRDDTSGLLSARFCNSFVISILNLFDLTGIGIIRNYLIAKIFGLSFEYFPLDNIRTGHRTLGA